MDEKIEKTEAQRLFDEGKAILDELDALDERESKHRTMGNMAYSSYTSDMFRRAVAKFHEAFEAEQREK